MSLSLVHFAFSAAYKRQPLGRLDGLHDSGHLPGVQAVEEFPLLPDDLLGEGLVGVVIGHGQRVEPVVDLGHGLHVIHEGLAGSVDGERPVAVAVVGVQAEVHHVAIEVLAAGPTGFPVTVPRYRLTSSPSS